MQGVRDNYVTDGAGEQDAAVTDVMEEPAGFGGGEEGEGEVGGQGNGAGCRRGRVRCSGGC